MREFVAKVLADGLAPSLARWSLSRERAILAFGEPLPPSLIEFATKLGIDSPKSLRLELADPIPFPVPQRLIGLAQSVGLPAFNPSGMCLGRGISAISKDPTLLRHELVHTVQYQQLGGHQPFMWQYLFECFSLGYPNAPLEIEARALSSNA